MAKRLNHGYLRRIGPGDRWQCDEPTCSKVGTLKEVRAQSCTVETTPEQSEENIFKAIRGDESLR